MSGVVDRATGRSRLSEDDRRLVAALQRFDGGLSPVVDQLIAGELTPADRRTLAAAFEGVAELVRGRVIDAGGAG